jgi:hypothetical protein
MNAPSPGSERRLNFVYPDGKGWKIVSALEDYAAVGWSSSEERAKVRARELDRQHVWVFVVYDGLIERLQKCSRLPWHGVLRRRLRQLVAPIFPIRPRPPATRGQIQGRRPPRSTRYRRYG